MVRALALGELLSTLEATQEKLSKKDVDPKDKYTPGLRVQMLLEDDEGKAYYGGHVITVNENGLDIYFDDDDFQMDVAFDD
eukprot:SAG11_NODE_29231_length_313_cov_0.719626_1_plen_80_part_10